MPTSDGDAVFIREFPLSRLPEETQADAHRQEDAVSVLRVSAQIKGKLVGGVMKTLLSFITLEVM